MTAEWLNGSAEVVAEVGACFPYRRHDAGIIDHTLVNDGAVVGVDRRFIGKLLVVAQAGGEAEGRGAHEDTGVYNGAGAGAVVLRDAVKQVSFSREHKRDNARRQLGRTVERIKVSPVHWVARSRAKASFQPRSQASRYAACQAGGSHPSPLSYAFSPVRSAASSKAGIVSMLPIQTQEVSVRQALLVLVLSVVPSLALAQPLPPTPDVQACQQTLTELTGALTGSWMNARSQLIAAQRQVEDMRKTIADMKAPKEESKKE